MPSLRCFYNFMEKGTDIEKMNYICEMYVQIVATALSYVF